MMLKQTLKSKFLVQRLLPVALSLALGVSATATAANRVAEGHKTTQTVVAAQDKKPAGKTEQKKNDKAVTKDENGKPIVKTPPAVIEAAIASATPVDPLEMLKAPGQYLNKKVTFTGTFNRFADIGLDYKKAFRDSRDYVTFFVLRPDVKAHLIPLAEMKLFFPRKKSDEVMELEAGDKIQIVGTEFATALDEPWIDVEHIKILEKTAKPERKHEPEF